MLELTDVEVLDAGATRRGPLSLRLGPGEAATLEGPVEGTGAALLRVAVGVEPPAAGAVRLLDTDLLRAGRGPLRAALSRVGYLPRHGALISNLTLRGNLELPLRWHLRLGAAELARRGDAALRRVGLDQLPAMVPAEAPLALRRRVALARALVLEPELLVLEDPLDDLPPADAAAILRTVLDYRRARGAAVLIATDDPALSGQLGARRVVLEG